MHVSELVSWLGKVDASELAMMSERLPCVKVSGEYKPIAQAPMSADEIYHLLAELGGSKQLTLLGPKPVQWQRFIEGVGPCTIMAVQRGEVLQAKLLPQLDFAQRAALQSKSVVAPQRAPQLPLELEAPLILGAVIAAPKAQPGRPPDVRGQLQLDASAPALDVDFAPSPQAVSAAIVGGQTSYGAPPALQLDDVEPPNDIAINAASPLHDVSFDGIDALLRMARERRASDLHIVAGRPAIVRVSGDLVTLGTPMDANTVAQMLQAIVPSKRLLEIFEKEGSCDFALEHGNFGRFRVNVARQRTGLKGSFRLIQKEIPTLESLGLPQQIAHATHHHQGLIVVTGPTGHGKTSTLTAIVDLINSTRSHHIITVEDPIEYIHPRKKAMMSQREVGSTTRSFAAALKGSLRQDPDVIVIGELRDTETVRIALSASETGHLVVGTMNTPSAAKTIDRLIDMFPPGDQAQVRTTLAGGLRLIVSQRLVPAVNPDGTLSGAMVAAAEVLPGSVPLWNLIREQKTYQIPSLQQRGKALGIVRLDDSLAELVRSGKSKLEFVKQYAEAPDEFEKLFRQPAPQPVQQAPGKEGGFLSRAGALFDKAKKGV